MMNRLRKLFGGLRISWVQVILFAVITGVYTAVMNLIPATKYTSFRDIAVTIEWWALFGLIIAVNCEKPTEAALKVLVFFVISQPLVYLIEGFFIGFGVLRYLRIWGVYILMTPIAGFLAFYAKNGKWWGALILGVMEVLLAYLLIAYAAQAIATFPHHLLTSLFIAIEMIIVILALVPNGKLRLIPALMALVTLLGAGWLSAHQQYSFMVGGEGAWTISSADLRGIEVKLENESLHFVYSSAFAQEGDIVLTNEEGETLTLHVQRTDNGLSIKDPRMD